MIGLDGCWYNRTIKNSCDKKGRGLVSRINGETLAC